MENGMQDVKKMPVRRIAAWTLVLLIAGVGYVLYRVDHYPAYDSNLWLVVKNHTAIAALESQQADLKSAIDQCEAKNSDAAQRQAQAGIGPESPRFRWPACNDQLRTWAQRQDKNEHELYFLKTGTEKPPEDYNCCAFPDEDNRNTTYVDEDGNEHELPTAPYYFKDRATGKFVRSDTREPPDDQHDYEPLHQEENE
jgi:cell division protein FtsB